MPFVFNNAEEVHKNGKIHLLHQFCKRFSQRETFTPRNQADELSSQPAQALPAGRLLIWNIKSAMFFPSHISSYSAWPLSWYVNKVYHHSIKCRYSALFKLWRWCIIRYVAHWGSPAVYLAIKPQSASSETAVGPGEVHLCMKYSQSNNANLKHQ